MWMQIKIVRGTYFSYLHYFDLVKDKFMILASDGLWNTLQPQEAMEIVENY